MAKFSNYLKKKKPIIKTLIEELGKEYKYVSVLGTDVKGTSINVNKFTINVKPTNITESGFVIKVYNNKVYNEYSINDINEKNFNNIIEDIRKLTSVKYDKTVNIGLLNDEPLVQKFNREDKGKTYTTEEIITILKGYIDYAFSLERSLIDASTSIEVLDTSKMFMSKNRDLEQHFVYNSARFFALTREENNTKYAYDGFGSVCLDELIKDLKVSVEETTKLAKELLSSTIPVPGIYDIVTDPSITGLIAHEAFGHGVEMDMYVKDRAKSVEYINKPVASKLITMHDGAASAISSGSYFFDDEGVLASDTIIIDKGILKRGISDAISALQLNTIPTGNSRRQSYKRKAYTRMTNTYFEKGTSTVEDMIKSIDYGYYISTTNNGMEDPKNWGIQCTAHYGREIKDGKFTGKLISPVVISGYVIDLLESVSAVSNNFKVIGSGSCGKGYKEWVRVADGGACIKARVKIG